MKIRMTNEEMAAAIEALAEAEEQGRLGYVIARNLRKLREEAAEYIEMRGRLYMKYGRDAGGGRYSVDAAGLAKINEEMDGVPKLECDVEILTVDEDTFTGGGLSSRQMERLLWMVEQKDTGKKD